MKKNKGITLIALVITIVVMIILAGVAINLTLGENGIFRKATAAEKQYQIAAAKEQIDLKIAELQAEKEGTATLEELVEYLKEDTSINYTVSLTELTASVSSDITVGDASEIYVVYKVYQFKVNKKLETTFVSIIGSIDNIQTGNLPENTPTTNAGTEVKLPDSWATETMRYVSTTDGKDVTETTKVSTVYAISVGDGNTVPVPYGFYYVGGNLTTGVVISDNKTDMNKYKDAEDVPSGITLNDDGTISYNLIGNLFVWVPATKETYVKKDWTNSVIYDEETYQAEILQIEKYGGFYVGRYEAGLAKTISEITTTQKNDGSNKSYNVTGMPQSKAGIIPWCYIDYETARKNSEGMYNNNYVKSGLITGTQWDTMISWMTGSTTSTDLTTTSNWGNSCDTQLEYIGRTANGYFSGGAVYLDKYTDKYEKGTTSSTSIFNGKIWTTGASESAKKKNLYDVAGNLQELTEEKAIATPSKSLLNGYRVNRGSAWYLPYASYTVSNRDYSDNSIISCAIGFRVVLYIK